MNQAIVGITAYGVGWPVAAPTLANVTRHKTTLATKIAATDAAFAAWRTAVADENAAATVCQNDMRGIDEATDMIYGPSGGAKTNFGLEPKGSPIAPLHKLIDIKVSDGVAPASILFDWENIEGATFEVQWFTDSGLTQIVGSATSTRSDFTITGLTSGTQYWMHVRPHRGGQTAPWSDPATRVAPV